MVVMLEDLPSERVSEIASHLAYRDINTFCQALTRKDLHKATNAHVVWLKFNLATQYLAGNPCSHLSNIRSPSSLTTDQLRHRFEKQLMVNDIWRLSKEVYPSIKRFTHLSSVISSVRVAPGGRWVFCGTRDCIVYYWDIDSDDPEPSVLVTCDDIGNTPGSDCFISKIEFAVQHGDPLSGFTVAFVGGIRKWHSRSQTYQDFATAILCRGPCLSFNGCLAAHSVAKRVDVYWWKDCTETHLVRCTLVFKKNCIITDIYVLGDDKILVYTRYRKNNKVRLYTLKPECSEVNKYPETVSYGTKIWTIPFLCLYSGREISRLYFDGTNYHQTIGMLDGIFILTIPASQVNEPTLVKVSDFDVNQPGSDVELYGLGLNKGYYRVGKKLYRFGYSLDSAVGAYESVVMLDSRIHHILEHYHNFPSFDKELGRLVSVYGGRVVVQDFSLPLYKVADVCPDSDGAVE